MLVAHLLSDGFGGECTRNLLLDIDDVLVEIDVEDDNGIAGLMSRKRRQCGLGLVGIGNAIDVDRRGLPRILCSGGSVR